MQSPITCSKCEKEKTADQFYRRGATLNTVCKTCFKAYYSNRKSSPSPREEKKFDVEANGQVIVRLESRIRRVCSRFASGDEFIADDIFGHVVEKLLVQIQDGDSDARVLQLANWRAHDFLEKALAYSFFVGSEGEIAHIDSEEPESDVFEMYVGDSMSVEDLIIAKEQAQALSTAVEKLTPEYRKVVEMLYTGKSRTEIAKALDKSQAWATKHIKNISEILGDLGVSASFA